MAQIKNDRRYTNDHEWALQEGELIRVGITDYAQNQLGEILFVEVPVQNSTVEKGKPFGSLEASKTIAELFAPVSGTVTEMNNQLSDNASLINSDCYGAGWIALIKPANATDFSTLLDADDYCAFTSNL